VGQGGRLGVDASGDVIHPQRRIIGSWVTCVPRMGDLLEHLARWTSTPSGSSRTGSRWPRPRWRTRRRTPPGGKVALLM
jgi:hypothetical protein